MNDDPDRLKRLSEALARHDALIADHAAKGLINRVQASQHGCDYPNCNKLGSISHGTKGGGKFYCWEHFQRTA